MTETTALELLAVALFFVGGTVLSLAFAVIYLTEAALDAAHLEIPWVFDVLIGGNR